ncbi:MAG: SagB/ThcOx family dehydrogenase [Actinobacteria bacterium]|nr:SagB/ThcOx family dehydrogenase [Actinomycetota bacterium]
MRNKRVKNLTLAFEMLITFLILVSLLISLISCNGLREVSSYITHTIKEKSKDIAGEEEDEIKNNMKGEEIMLPQPELKSNISLEEALNSRRSVRSFSSKELSLDQISQILWAAQGITQESTGYRTSPSAGALYPLEIFLLKSDGVFHYIPDGHKIIKLSSDDLRPNLIQGALFQGFVAEAPVNIIITAVYERTTVKYGERGIRYVHLEAGHSCQNILLQAVALGLGAVPVGAFDDSYIQDLLDLPRDHIPLYIIPIGYPEE